MDTAFKDNLDQYINKLQRIAIRLNGVRGAHPLRIGREGAAIAMRSTRLFLSYCALVSLVRKRCLAPTLKLSPFRRLPS
ncbi:MULTISPECIES: hypothetical protein [Rhizobium]|uniref:Uncharacterized protein n=1 Tax=Rhizobium phaseoli TaxID=396 RepID=A0A7X6F8T7_9HYPH|nr:MULTISPECIES: hypothetical protein [Rhizobium]MDE8761819.1 hypothetical protein [Rhizobium sp. CBK13]NKF15115.1 hypothetical protein [Rhizobium phaseoli]QPK09207.1 hypothetical protein HER27_001075 [Rhizobium phaseoli]